MRIDVLTLDGVLDLGLAAFLDVFQTANELGALMKVDDVARFDVARVGVRRVVQTSHGLSVPLQRPRPNVDCVVIPAIGYKSPETLAPALQRSDVREAAAALATWSKRGTTVAAACIGTFVLAESGLLRRQRATTTWWLAPFFRTRYPDVVLEESRMIVPAGNVVTAGAALSHFDLALWLVRRASPQLAALTAKYLIIDSRSSQSAYMLTDHLAHSDPIVERFESWARHRLDKGFSLADAATAAGASKRTLTRHVQHAIGKSPLAYFQQLRVERAVHLLKTESYSVDAVAVKVGYANAAALRTLLRRKLNVGVKDVRRPMSDE